MDSSSSILKPYIFEKMECGNTKTGASSTCVPEYYAHLLFRLEMTHNAAGWSKYVLAAQTFDGENSAPAKQINVTQLPEQIPTDTAPGCVCNIHLPLFKVKRWHQADLLRADNSSKCHQPKSSSPDQITALVRNRMITTIPARCMAYS